MALILCIETATPVCSVAIAKDGKVISCVEENKTNIHASALTVFIQEALEKANYSLKDIDAIAVSKGPGSYTGLRIGVSTAKGLCYALEKPLIAVNTLQAMTYGLMQINQSTNLPAGRQGQPINNFFCPMLDARRMEVYTALFDQTLNTIKETSATILDESFLKEELAENKIFFFGNGAEKCKPLLESNPNAVFIDNFHLSAKFLSQLAEEKFKDKNFEDVAYFEPFYLKDFVSTAKKE